MLYRRFPKISNNAYSILTLSVSAGADEALIIGLLGAAREFGINLIDTGPDTATTGANPARVALIRTLAERELLGAGFSFLLRCGAKTPEEFSRFLDEAGASTGDLVAVNPISALASAAARAKSSGRIAGYGFLASGTTTGDTAAIADGLAAALEKGPEWDFFAVPFNYLVRDLDDAFARAAERETAVIALDPFAGGALESVPANVHELFKHAPVPRSHDEWALRAIWERQEVATVVWAPANRESLIRKAIFAEAGRPNSLPSKELAVIKAAAEALS